MQDLATRNAELEQKLAQQREEITLQREENAQQREEIAQLKALVVELREELNRHSGNSSRPPSSDSPSQREKNRQKRKRRGAKKRRGGQPGHKGRCRELLAEDDVDAFKDHYPCECENCWRPLREVPDGDCMRFQVTELIGKGGVEVTEHRYHSVRCLCGHVTSASRAAMPKSAFGPRLCATIAMLTGVFHLSRRQVVQLLWDLFGVGISLGSVSNIEGPNVSSDLSYFGARSRSAHRVNGAIDSRSESRPQLIVCANSAGPCWTTWPRCGGPTIRLSNPRCSPPDGQRDF